MNPITVLWIYIAFLVLGGLMGFLKAKSKMSLIMSLVFAIPLALCALGILKSPTWLADALLIFLLIFFGLRFAKSKKMMPNGLMTILSVLALVLRNVRF
jgi:uncharacterized membrane protein (UPF0136 family)